MRAKPLLVAALILLPEVAAAQSPPAAPDTIAVGDWQLAPSAELRTRAEYRRDSPELGGLDISGVPSPRVRDAWLVLERARLGLGAERASDRGALRAQITLQDARAWGTTPFGVLGIHEAYGEARNAAARPAFLRLGRQVVSWGEGRLVGSGDWAAIPAALDAARGGLALGPLDVEALAALVQAPSPSSPTVGQRFGPPSTGTQLYGLHVAWPIAPLFKVEGTGLARVARSGGGTTRFGVAQGLGETYVASLRAWGDARPLRYGVEGAYEFGEASALAGGPTRSAWAAAAHVGRTFPELVLTPSLDVGGSYATGDEGGGKYTQFDPILPTVHTHYGAMDLFSWSNTADVNARLGVVPFTDTTLAFEYRYARLVEASGEWLNAYLTPVGQPITNGESELGHELDVVASWQPWAPLDLRAGYSALLLGDGARTTAAASQRGFAVGNGTYAPPRLSHLSYLQATLRIP